MNSFIFKNSTEIIFGRGTVDKVGEEVRKYGKKILLARGDKFIKRSGILDRVATSLKRSEIEIVEFAGIVPNPRLSRVQEGIEICKKNKIDLVLALGGGSVIDTAKAIGVGAHYDGNVWDFFDVKATPKTSMPVGVVLTIPGAGSESSLSSVITNDKTLVKRGLNVDVIRPKFAIMDAELTLSIPRYPTACGIVDAMSHAMERYFTAVKNVDCTDWLCEAVLKCLIKNGLMILDDLGNYDIRAEIMLASKFAHDNTVGAGRVGDFTTHKIAQELSAKYDAVHCATISSIYPAWMKYVYKHGLSRFVQFAVRVWNVDYSAGSEEAVALEGINRYVDFLRKMGMPTSLKELNIDNPDIEDMAERCIRLGNGVLGEFKKLTKTDIINIYNIANERN